VTADPEGARSDDGPTGAAGWLRAGMVAYRDLLRDRREVLNDLNVYPVPDGDTGTNLLFTMEAVVDALRGPADSLAVVAERVSEASLMGARGNSGVILSQVLRALVARLATDGLEPAPLAEALADAARAARAAVQRPVEGTVLSVADAAAAAVRPVATGDEGGCDLPGVLARARAAAVVALARTPEQLPTLAEAGVVDAGGAGFVLLLDGLAIAAGARPPALELPVRRVAGREATGDRPPETSIAGTGRSGLADPDALGARSVTTLSPRYEVMFLLDAPESAIPAFREAWAGVGESIVVVGGDRLFNCHIHTDDIGAAIETALDVGRPRRIRVADLADQVGEERWVREASPVPPVVRHRRTAVVAVADGRGLETLFTALGATVVRGADGANPSVEELLRAAAIDSDEIIFLANNPNVVPVAEQAVARLDRPGGVLPTADVAQGMAALCDYDPEAGLEENLAAMRAALERVRTGAVTQAVRDSASPSGPIRAGEWLGLVDGRPEVVAATLTEATCGLLAKLLRPEHELVTLLVGELAEPSATREIGEWLQEQAPQVELEVHMGAQPLYAYHLSVE